MHRQGITVFISSTPSDFQRVRPSLSRLEKNGWNLVCGNNHARELALSAHPVENSDMVLAFISADYIADKSAFVSELSYAACACRKPYILVALDTLENLPPDMEMLAAGEGFVETEGVEPALKKWLGTPQPELLPVHKERRYAFKPFEACEEQYAFVSYAHDDALEVYPVIKELYESGINLWYDEGIRITERYLPEIARHVRDCEVFLLFVTETSVRRPFVIDFELAYAKKLGKKIVPVMMELVERLPENIAGLERVVPDESLWRAVAGTGLKNFGQRTAVPPKDKKEADYDLQQLTPMTDYQYRLSGRGIYLTKYTGDKVTVVVPAEHCGLPVCGLEGTFYKQRLLKVECPETVTIVKNKTFQKCYTLRKVIYKAPKIKVESEAYRPDLDSDLLPVGGTFIFALLLGLYGLLGVILSPTLRIPDYVSESFIPYYRAIGGIIMFIAFFGGGFLFSALVVPIIRAIRKKIYSIKTKSQLTVETPNLTKDDAEIRPFARACFYENGDISGELEKLRAEGFLIRDWTGDTEPDDAEKIMLVFLTKEFFRDDKLLDALHRGMAENRKIIPVYWSVQPAELPQNLAANLGQIQGLFPNTAEFYFLLRRTLKDAQCWRNLIDDFEYTVKKGEIALTKYIGPDADAVYIPKQLFDPPQPVVRVAPAAFDVYRTNSTKIKRMYIPDSIEKISGYALKELWALEEINVHGDNQHYYIDSGVFCRSKNGETLCCPSRHSERVLLSNRTKSIGKNSFAGCKKLEEVVLGDSVREIGKYAFWGSTSLQSIFIPAGVKKIGKGAFLSFKDRSLRSDLHYGDASRCKVCPKLTVHTPAGSFAEQYSKKNNIPCKTYTATEWENMLGKLRST